MVVVAKITRVDLLEMVERHGTPRRLVHRARVTGLTETDPGVLAAALAAAGVPASGSQLTDYPNLVLTERVTRLVEGEPTVVDVDLIYEHLLNDGQIINNPLVGAMLVRASATVNQVKTNKDIFGNVIEVEHTYPPTDPKFPGETKTQGGEVDLFQVMRTYSIEGTKSVNRPWLIASSIVGRVNSNQWSGGEVHEWLCTGVSWEIIDKETSPTNYLFTFEVQHNPETWNPVAVFIDDRTGKPPPDLIEDTGFKTVRTLREADFEAVIGTRIQGA